MADQIDQSAEGTGTSEESPVGNSVGADLETKLMAALRGELDTRFSGFQSLIDKKVTPLASELAELKTAGMSPEEREQLEEDAARQRMDAVLRENELLKLRQTSPDEVDFLMALEKAESFEDQLELVRERFGAKAAQKVEAAVEAAENSPTPAVDQNNPPRDAKQGIGAALDGGEMNDDIADALLSAASGRSLASFRKPRS